jgi:hypothetical protein
MFALMAIGGAIAEDSRLTVGKISHRLVEPVYDDGDVRISVKIPVNNASAEKMRVLVTVQAVDADGFEVIDTSADGLIEAWETGILSDWFFIQEDAYLTIDKWVLDSIGGFGAPVPPSLSVVLAGDVAHKLIEPEDEDGQVRFAVKVTVENRAEHPQSVTVDVEGFDIDGFMLTSMRLTGVVGADENRTLSDSGYLNKKAYSDVVKWKAEVKSARPSPKAAILTIKPVTVL